MKPKFPIFPTLLLLLLFAGCIYNPVGEHFKELDSQGTPPTVVVELNFDTDTIYIAGNDWILFRYITNGAQVNWSRFIIDGTETSQNPDMQGGIELQWYIPGLQPGVHTLSMQLFTRSGTGSIADYVGAEGFLMQNDWVLIVADAAELAPSIVETFFENGLLNIRWEKYKGLNFESYQVYKYVQPSGLPDQLVAIVTDQHQTSAADANYHGENSRYYVVVNNLYSGMSVDVQGPLPQVTIKNTPQGDIVLHWEIPAYRAALKGYRILEDKLSWTSSGFVPLHLINDPLTDSLLITDPYFGHRYMFWLQLDPKGTAYYENHSRPVLLATNTPALYGHESPQFEWTSTGTGNFVYMAKYDGLKIFNTHTLETFTSGKKPAISRFHVSANDKYLIGREGGNSVLYLYDLNNPDNNKTIDMSSSTTGLGYLASVSDKGTGIILNGETAVLYDYLSEQVLAEKEIGNNGLYRNHMSGDGNYFLLSTYAGYSWYSCQNNTITELQVIREAETGTVFSDFIPGERTRLAVATVDHVSVYDCRTQELQHLWQFEPGVNTTVYHVVKSSGELFISEGENMLLLDLTTGARTHLGKTKSTGTWDLVYSNGQILWNMGRRLDVTGKLKT